MGLDISAYSHIKVIGAADQYNEDLEDDGKIEQEYVNEHFPHAVPADWDGSRYLRWQATEQTESTSFRAGSYSGYGLFRSTLAGAFLDTKDLYSDRLDENGDWEKVYESAGKPFYEMVNFSDCEGVMFGPVCEKLYNDFVSNREAYEKFLLGMNPYPSWNALHWIRLYDEWMTAFDLARKDGLLSFH